MIRTAVRFGAFVVVCFVLTLALAFRIGNIRSVGLGPFTWGVDQYELTAAFDDVTGLIPGDRVKIAGVEVGRVGSIRTERGYAVVTVQIDDGVRVPDDSTIAIRWRNLIGQRDIYIRPGSSPTRFESGARFGPDDTVSVVDIGELFNRLGPIVGAIDPDQVNDFLDTVAGALDGNEDNLRQSIDDLAQVATVLGERDQAIGRIIENLDLVAQTINDREVQISQVLDNLVILSQTFSDNTALLDEALVELGDLGASLGGILQANSAEIDRILANLSVLVEIVDDKLQEGKLRTIVELIDEGTAAVFRIGKDGEWQNQAILCAAEGPPVDGECPTGILTVDPVTGGAAQPTRVVGPDLLELLRLDP